MNKREDKISSSLTRAVNLAEKLIVHVTHFFCLFILRGSDRSQHPRATPIITYFYVSFNFICFFLLKYKNFSLPFST